MERGTCVSIDPEVLGGTPDFTGTRVPIRSLFDHLEAGDSLEAFQWPVNAELASTDMRPLL